MKNKFFNETNSKIMQINIVKAINFEIMSALGSKFETITEFVFIKLVATSIM